MIHPALRKLTQFLKEGRELFRIGQRMVIEGIKGSTFTSVTKEGGDVNSGPGIGQNATEILRMAERGQQQRLRNRRVMRL